MHMRCRMLLYDKAEALCGSNLSISARFSRFREVPFSAVFCKQLSDHAGTVNVAPTELKVPGPV
jgi:hypothetical protein